MRTVLIVVALLATFIAVCFGAGWLLSSLSETDPVRAVAMVFLALVVVLAVATGTGTRSRNAPGDGGGADDHSGGE